MEMPDVNDLQEAMMLNEEWADTMDEAAKASPFKIFSSRSRILEFQRCPRAGYYKYHHLGRGIDKAARSIYLITGLAVHKGVETALRLVISNECKDSTLFTSKVIGEGLAEFRSHCENSESHNKSESKSIKEQIDEVLIKEQAALVEGLLYTFCLKALPSILDRFTIEMVEKEISGDIGPATWEARVDAVVTEKSSGNVYSLSFKTTKDYDKRKEQHSQHDMQGISESYFLTQHLQDVELAEVAIDSSVARLSQNKNASNRTRNHLKTLLKTRETRKKLGPEVTGVKMFYFLKGYRKSEEIGIDEVNNEPISYKATQSWLIRGWKKSDGFETEYAHSYYFPNPNNKSGQGRLGKGWEAFNVWDLPVESLDGYTSPVLWWIDMIAGGHVQPECGDVLDSCFIEPPEYMRDENEQMRWFVQVTYQEQKIQEGLMKVEEALTVGANPNEIGDSVAEALDKYFPQFEKSCHYPLDCDFLPMCYGDSPEVRLEPIESGVFKLREPHHELEREAKQ